MTIPDWPPPTAPPECDAHPDRADGSVGWQCNTCIRQDSEDPRDLAL